MRTIALSLFALAALLPAQERALCIKNARIVPVEGDPLENGMLLAQNGKIQAIGKDLEIPAGALVVDARGGTLTPGLVSAFFRLGGGPRQPTQSPGGQRGRRGQMPQMPPPGDGGALANKAATKVAPTIYVRQPVFGDLLAQGVTTLALAPSGAGFSGQAALLDPAGKTLDTLVTADSAYQLIAPQNNSRSKELAKTELDKAKKFLDDKSRPAPASQPSTQAAPPPASQPVTAPSGTPTTAPAPAGQPPAQPDKNVEALAEMLSGRQRAFVELNSATDVSHFLDGLAGHRFPCVVVAARPSGNEGPLELAVAQLKELKAPVLLPPSLTTVPLTRDLVNPAARLAAAGLEVGFLVGDSRDQVRSLFFRLTELVRTGLTERQALAGVTLVPAKMLGIEARKGSLKLGKDADVVLWSGDPFDPASRLVKVWHAGIEVAKETKE